MNGIELIIKHLEKDK